MPELQDSDLANIANGIVKRASITSLLGKLADKRHYYNYSKPVFDLLEPLDFICGCTCESLLARAHFTSYVLLNSLICMDSIIPYRLSSGHGIKEFYKLKGTILANEPLYKVNTTFSSLSKHRISYEFAILKSTAQIIEDSYKRDSIQPYKAYWYLSKKLDIPPDITSRFNSSPGIVRLTLMYLMKYKGIGLEKASAELLYNEFLSIKKDIEKTNPEVLPRGVIYNFNEGYALLKKFLNSFQEFFQSADADEKKFLFGRITSFAIQIMRVSSDYMSVEFQRNLNKLIEEIDKYLQALSYDIDDKYFVEYYFENRWRAKVRILSDYNFSQRNIEFIKSQTLMSQLPSVSAP